MRSKIVVLAMTTLLVVPLGACRVTETDEGEYEVEPAEVQIEGEKRKVKVPDVDVTMEEREVTLPDIDVKDPDEADEEEELDELDPDEPDLQ